MQTVLLICFATLSTAITFERVVVINMSLSINDFVLNSIAAGVAATKQLFVLVRAVYQ